MKVQTYVAVNREGKICGPVGEYDFVKEALIVGYRRVQGERSEMLSDSIVWGYIEMAGYKIKKCEITILD